MDSLDLGDPASQNVARVFSEPFGKLEESCSKLHVSHLMDDERRNHTSSLGSSSIEMSIRSSDSRGS